MIAPDRLVTIAIHTYERAVKLKQILGHYDITAVIHNVNLIRQSFSSAVRVRISEKDLSRALQIIEGKSLDDLYLTVSAMEGEEKLKILIPVDLTDHSINRCKVGFDLAERFNAEVVLLHSFMGSNKGGGLLFRGNSYKMLKIITAKEDLDTECDAVVMMEELVDKLNDLIANGNLPNINFDFEISQGVPEDIIMETAKRLTPILIIMGSSNREDVDLLGSITAEVLDAAKYTVLTIPDDIDSVCFKNVNKVVLFTDFHQNDLYLFEPFIKRFKGRNMDITFVGIAEEHEGVRRRCLESLIDFCESTYPDFTFSYKDFIGEGFLDSFDEFIRTKEVDLLIIPNKKRNIISRLLSSSMAQRVLFSSDVPILAIPH